MAYPFAAAEVLTAVDLNAMIGAPTQNAITTVTYTAVLLDAGKTVTLSNASAVTLTIPAQASISWADNTQLNFLNLGAGTVTITPAVDVTINGTPLTLATSKGGSLVRTASNTWTFTPTGGDSPGLNAVAPTSIANSGGSASTTGNTTTFAAVTSLTLNGVFTSDHTNYEVIISFSATAGPSFFNLRFASAGVANTSTYLTQRLDASASSITTTSSNTTSGYWAAHNGAIATVTNLGRAVISGPATTNPTTWMSHTAYPSGATATGLGIYSGIHNVGSAFDGLVVFPTSGNITGTIQVFGYEN